MNKQINKKEPYMAAGTCQPYMVLFCVQASGLGARFMSARDEGTLIPDLTWCKTRAEMGLNLL